MIFAQENRFEEEARDHYATYSEFCILISAS